MRKEQILLRCAWLCPLLNQSSPPALPCCREFPGTLEAIRVWFRDYKASACTGALL